MKRKSSNANTITNTNFTSKQNNTKTSRELAGTYSFKDCFKNLDYDTNEESETKPLPITITTPKSPMTPLRKSSRSKSQIKSYTDSSTKKSNSQHKRNTHSYKHDLEEAETEENSNQFNSQLENIMKSFSFINKNNDMNKNNKNKLFSQYVSFSKFPYDHSLSKEIDIEIILEKKSEKITETDEEEKFNSNRSNSKSAKSSKGRKRNTSAKKQKHKDKHFPDNEDLLKISKKIEDALNLFFKKCPFIYHEFSNPKGRVNFINSSIDNINYDFLYEKHANVNLNSIENQNKALAVIKDINYISAFSSVFKRFIRGEIMNEKFENYNSQLWDNLFYIVTPMVTFYFAKFEKSEFWTRSGEDVRDTGAFISNTHRVLEKMLKDYGIHYKRIEVKKLENNNKKNTYNYNKQAPTIPLYSLQNNTSEVEVMNNFITDGHNQNSDSLIYITKYYYTLLFNMILNEYEESSMNIYCPFPFENSTRHNCKIQIESFIKPETSSLSVNLKIFGCIFNTHLMKLIRFLTGQNELEEIDHLTTFLKEELEMMDYSFNVKFHPFMRSSSFYGIHTKLTGPVDKVIFRDEEYKVKMHNY
jgi:hypothetical protein